MGGRFATATRAALVAIALTFAGAVVPASAPAQPAVSGGGGTMHAGAVSGGVQAHVTTTTPRAQADAAPPPPDYSVTGIDVSSIQSGVNWTQVAQAGAKFAYVKATEGTTYTNPYFSEQYGGAKTAGLYAGAYAFGRPDANDPVAQADYLASNAQYTDDGATLPLLLDLEAPYFSGPNACWNQSQAGMVAWIRAFVNEARAKTGKPMVIYTTTSWWNTCTGSNASFADQWLHVADWNATPPTTLPAGWSAWTFWQYADSGALPGDQDVFHGSLSELAQLAEPVAPAAPVVLSVAPTGSGAVVGVRAGVAGGAASVSVTASPGGESGTGSVNAAGDAFVSVSGLAAGTAYTFSAVASGPGGLSPVSAPGGPVTPSAGSGSGDFVPVGPVRSYDFRDPGSSALGSGQARSISVAGVAGVPATGVSAVALAVSVVAPSRAGYVTVWPAGQARPLATTVNFNARQTKTDLTKVPVGADGQVSIYNFAGTTGFTFDVVGYYADATLAHNVSFAATAPYRVLDTRPQYGGTGPLDGGATVSAQVRGEAGVPADATAVEINVEAIDPSAAGYLTVWADGTTRPVVSNVLYGAGSAGTVVTSAIAPIGADGKIRVFANTGTNVAVDVNGYYAASAAGRFHAITPVREYDTRTAPSTPLGPGETRYIQLAGLTVDGATPVPATATGAVFAATAVDNTSPGYLTFWPADQSLPVAANLLPNTPRTLTDNLAVTGLAPRGDIPGAVGAYNYSGSTDLVIDVDGYYTAGP